MSVASRVRSRWAAALVLVASLGAIPVTGVGSSTAATAGGDSCGPTRLKANGDAWSCTLADDFDGTALDTSRWVAADTQKSGYRIGKTCFHPERNIAVADGSLHLTVSKRESGHCGGAAGIGTTHIGGAISTWGTFEQTYGLWETRMRFPEQATRGLWGGFWANPKDRVYGPWPASGEIDVAEWMSGMAEQVVPSLHYTGRTTEDTGWECGVPDVTEFHTYAVEWSPEVMRFYYDGELCFTRAWAPTSLRIKPPAPFDQPFVPALLATTGQGWNSVPLGGSSNGTFEVDYVRIWG